MKCPTCNAWVEVIETRQRKGYTYRRYTCANKHRFSTRESPVAVTSKADTLKRLNAALNSAVRMTPATA